MVGSEHHEHFAQQSLQSTAHTMAETRKTGNKLKIKWTDAKLKARPQKRTLKRQKAQLLKWHVEVLRKIFKK